MKTVARRDGNHLSSTAQRRGYPMRGGRDWLRCLQDGADARPKRKASRWCSSSTAKVERSVTADLPKLGYKGVELCELSFDDCRVRADAILGGQPGEGFAQMMKGLETGRIQLASGARRGDGSARGRLRYAQERESSGSRSGNIGRLATIWRIWQPS